MAAYRGALLTAFQDVENSLSSYNHLQQQARAFANIYQRNQQLFASQRTAFVTGSASEDNMLTQQLTLLQAEQNLQGHAVGADAEQRHTGRKISVAVGGGTTPKAQQCLPSCSPLTSPRQPNHANMVSPMTLSPLRASVLSVGLTILAGCGKSSPPPAPPPPQVAVVKVAAQSIPLNKNLVGRLSSYLSANVTARISGVLVKRDYTEGSEVKHGQVLFEIEPAYYQTQLNLALGTLASDRATYTNDRITAERDRKLLPAGLCVATDGGRRQRRPSAGLAGRLLSDQLPWRARA